MLHNEINSHFLSLQSTITTTGTVGRIASHDMAWHGMRYSLCDAPFPSNSQSTLADLCMPSSIRNPISIGFMVIAFTHVAVAVAVVVAVAVAVAATILGVVVCTSILRRFG